MKVNKITERDMYMNKKARHSVKTFKSRLSLHELALVKGSCQKFIVIFGSTSMARREGVEAHFDWKRTKRNGTCTSRCRGNTCVCRCGHEASSSS